MPTRLRRAPKNLNRCPRDKDQPQVRLRAKWLWPFAQRRRGHMHFLASQKTIREKRMAWLAKIDQRLSRKQWQVQLSIIT